MRYVHKPKDEEVRAARRAAYLLACPVEAQLEALYEAALGRLGKLGAIQGKIESIRGRMKKW